MAAALLPLKAMPFSIVVIVVGALAMWVFTAGVAFVFTVQSLHRDSLPRAVVAALCAGIHVVLAALAGAYTLVYLPLALITFALATLAGSRSLLRLDPGL